MPIATSAPNITNAYHAFQGSCFGWSGKPRSVCATKAASTTKRYACWSTNSTCARPAQVMGEVAGGLHLHGRFDQRQQYLEARIPGFRTNIDTSSVLLDDSLHRIESQARSFSHALGGEEGLEDVGQYLRRNAWTVVGNLDRYAIVIAVGSKAQFTA